MLYSLAKSLLFQLDPERSHHLALTLLKYTTPFLHYPLPHYPTQVMGIDFPNPVGLAAGLDKNAAYVAALAQLGFGFIEVGTVTPRPQTGQPKPRLFRLPEKQALINRMGFNNVGIEQLIDNLTKQHYHGILGINIGKNADTPLENALSDYQSAFARVYPYASYVTVNISSPNTQGLRDLQQAIYLKPLLEQLKQQQARLAQNYQRYVPLVIKLSPDLDEQQLEFVAEQLMVHEIDGVIAVNTTLSRQGVEGSSYEHECGGLSGAPLTQRSTEVIKQLHQILAGKIPIIASGGIMSAQDAKEKLNVGASLIQLYTGLIYQGPGLIRQICTHLAR